MEFLISSLSVFSRSFMGGFGERSVNENRVLFRETLCKSQTACISP